MDQQTSAPSAATAEVHPAPAPPPSPVREPIETLLARRGLSTWTRALVTSHGRFAVGQCVTEAELDSALASARALEVK